MQYDAYKRIITAIEILNTHPFMSGAGKFTLDTSKDPWIVKILDIDGNVIFAVPPKRIIEISDLIEDMPPPGIAIDIEG
jgi:hypothetical protein